MASSDRLADAALAAVAEPPIPSAVPMELNQAVLGALPKYGGAVIGRRSS